MTGAAGQFGPAGHNHSVLHRNDVEPLTLIAPNLNEIALAGRATGVSRQQGFDDTRQMLWQLATIGPALGSSLLAGSGISAILGCFESCDGLFDVLQNKLKLISVQLFRRSTELRIFASLSNRSSLAQRSSRAAAKTRSSAGSLGNSSGKSLIGPSCHASLPDAAKILYLHASDLGCGIEARACA